MMEPVYVVDRNDNILKTIDRLSALPTDILRVTGIFITNNKQEILLQLRSKKKAHYPLCWDCSAGGHFLAGEAPIVGARRELFEETGIKTKLTFLDKHYTELDDGRRHIVYFFKGTYTGKFSYETDEVAKLKFFSISKIRKMITTEKMHPQCILGLKKYFL